MISMPATSAEWWVPSPVSVAITVGQWLMKDREQVYYIRVKAVGKDEVQAREHAFRLAVDQAIGALVLAETEVRNGNVSRDEIISYSSGFVRDFEIVERAQIDNRHELVLDVWVARSHLADRLLSQSRDRGNVAGGKISQQIETFQHSRKNADRVLQAVLSDFPGRAFDIQIGKTQVLVDEYRRPLLSVWIDIAWSSDYLRSLDEAVQTTSHVPDCDSWTQRNSNHCRNKFSAQIVEHTGYYDDRLVADLINRNMANDPPRLLFQVLDQSGNIIHRTCITPLGVDPAEYYPHYLYTLGYNGLKINHHRSRSGDIRIDLEKITTADLDRVEVEMTRRSRCTK
jgi:hypothetical protein